MKEFNLTGSITEKVREFLKGNKETADVVFIAQGGQGFNKEVFLVLTDSEILLFKEKKKELVVESRERSSLIETKVLLGTIQMTFLSKERKTSQLALAFKGESTQEIHKILQEAQSTKSNKLNLKPSVSPNTEELVDKGELIGTFQPESGLELHARRSSKYGDRKLGDLLQGGGKPIRVYTKVIERNERFYTIDAQVSVEVTFDGQVQVSRRPTLTRMGALAPLPGSALIAGFALGKKTTHDNREVHVSIAHPEWSLSIRIRPDDLGYAKSLAQRINAIAQSHTKNLIENKNDAAVESIDKIARLNELKNLLDSGFLSKEEVDKIKKEIVDS